MITTYIGFSNKTHKLFARMVCRKYKHCAPITVSGNKTVLYQFERPNRVIAIPIKRRDLTILGYYGWIFIKYDWIIIPEKIRQTRALTCVNFTKRACGIKNIKIQTPDALLKFLTVK
jgi:hypothetical protein